MSAFMIGYDLNRPGQDYKDLWDAIKTVGAWWHYLDSTWIVITDMSAIQIRDRLRPYLDKNDELLVAKLTGESAWAGFNQDASSWLSSNLGNVANSRA